MNSPSDLNERNLGAIFEILDTDHDGIIEEDDLAELAALVCDKLGVTGVPERAAIREHYLNWWEQLRADGDSDGDGQITAAEFTALVRSGKGDPQAYYQQQVSYLIKVVSEAMDHDSDGFIEQEAYARMLELTGMDRSSVLAGFSRLDSDGDGRITTAEFQAGVAHVFLSQDPADPGTAMLGHA